MNSRQQEKKMKLNTITFSIACAISASILWVICSLLVMAIPTMILSMSADMLHIQLDNMGWHLSFLGVVIGLVGWFFWQMPQAGYWQQSIIVYCHSK
jgi:nitrate/nitrite transporter NarK